MATSTITIKNETLALLKRAKEDMNSKTYDDLFRKLVIQSKMPKYSLRGKFEKLKPFVRDKIDRQF